MLNKWKLYELQTNLRSKLCELNKDEARTFDLLLEITEKIEKEKKEKEKPNKGLPKKAKMGKQENNLTIENYFKAENQIHDSNMDLD